MAKNLKFKNRNHIEVVDGCDSFSQCWPSVAVLPTPPRLKNYWQALCLVILGPSSNSPETQFHTAFYFVGMNIKEKIKSLLTEKGVELKARKIVMFQLMEIKIK